MLPQYRWRRRTLRALRTKRSHLDTAVSVRASRNRRACIPQVDIATRSPTVTANHGSERGLLTRGSTGRISVDWFIAPFGRVDMTDHRPLLRQRVWTRGRRHGGGRQNGCKSKPCKQGCGAANKLLEYLWCHA